jgi:hypothetical protein
MFGTGLDIDLTSALLQKTTLKESQSSLKSTTNVKPVKQNDGNLFVESKNIYDELFLVSRPIKLLYLFIADV